jgi:cell division protein FtsI/penicillin-binding protein 2
MNYEPPIIYDPIRWKAGVLIAAFFFLLSVVIGRLFWVQVVEGARYREAARKQYESAFMTGMEEMLQG